MSNEISGLHHVTAICGDPQRNYDFYAGILGLRLVKKTVNFDDPGTYHLYYADAAGTPGSVLTFFPWADIPNGRDGAGQVSAISFATTEAGLDFWVDRLKSKHIDVRGPLQRFEDVYIEFADPDGMRLEIVVADNGDTFRPWDKSGLPADVQLRGFHSVTLAESGYELTQALLVQQMGWTLQRESGDRFRYRAPGSGPASIVDVVCQPTGRYGLPGSGTVHHVAFRVADDAVQKSWREKLVKLGYNLSPVMDRNYFHSIYFREPGGILFEIATVPPGFAVDEAADSLGAELKLPQQYENLRSRIEAALPPLETGI